jgi:hypothetical protein
MRIYLFTLALILLTLSGYSTQLGEHHQDGDNNIKSHFGHLYVGDDQKPANVNSVKGNISLADDVYAQTIESASGDIALGRGASVHAVMTVNRNIYLYREIELQIENPEFGKKVITQWQQKTG